MNNKTGLMSVVVDLVMVVREVLQVVHCLDHKDMLS